MKAARLSMGPDHFGFRERGAMQTGSGAPP